MKAGEAEPAAPQEVEVRVVVLEPNPFYRRGLAATIEAHPELEVLGEAADSEEVHALLESMRPDVIVVDAVAGMDLLEELAGVEDAPRAVVLAGDPTMESAYRALAAGAAAFLAKEEADIIGLCEAILAVSRGQMVLSSGIQASIARDIREQRAGPPRPDLTTRELEVLTLTAQGLTASQTGERLEVSAATVKTHLHHLYKKLGVGGRAAAVAEAMRRGLVD
jgi:two-component system nitrate/nitrite response regulator NarL